ncbi:NUDIX domain-containing protein [Nonomuraea typhae]|uniref:NUDIX domain-containing protein n=1 Tax=Nonomuraea typhae TaxID=2603600 RepID=UPI001FE9551F|nr:NUDIX domain-containing protein [Nonomuraea typhae]
MTETRRVDFWQDPDAPKATSRKASASVFVQDEGGRILLLQRTDNDLWTIPTGGVKKDETVAEAGVRECREETGLDVEVVGLVGVFSTPDHLIAYVKGDKIKEVRQPINLCFRAQVVGGELAPDPQEAQVVAWVDPVELDTYSIHPAIRLRIDRALAGGPPFLG